jgi:penicillin-binding protein 1A
MNDKPPLTHRRRRLRRGRRSRKPLAILLVLAFAALALVGGTVAVAHDQWNAFRASCTLDGLHPKRVLGQNSYVYASDGLFLGVIPSKVHRQRVALKSISPWLKKATVSIEDRNFWSHDGVDYAGVVRAAIANARAGHVVQGASTLDQQVVRTLYLSRAQTLERKKKEACLALKIDAAWGKEKVLWRYLNTVYYGHLAYGVEAAAQTYFSKHARDLGPAQAATIAGLPQAPSRYDPLRHPKTALDRRNEVLQAMVATGDLTQKRANALKQKGLGLRPTHMYSTHRLKPFFDYVRKQLVARYGDRGTRRGGFRVFTTIDPTMQRLARRAIDTTLDRKGDPASALVSVDAKTGAIRAMASRVHGRQMDFNLAVQGKNEAGSTFKTFVLTAAVEQGMNPFSTYYLSAPFHYPVPGGDQVWNVHTYEGTYAGPETVEQGLIQSDNTIFARLTVDVGPAKVAQVAHRLGIRSKLLPVPSIGLGVNDVSVLEMASAYSSYASLGVHHAPYAIEKVLLPNGRYDEGWGPAKPKRVLSRGVARTVDAILRRNVLHGTGVNAQIGRPAAGKTGTTDKFTDAWFAGFTRHLATVVWVGYPNENVPMRDVHGIRVQGASFPSEIWRKLMGPATKKWKPQGFPPAGGVEFRPWHGAHSVGGGEGGL